MANTIVTKGGGIRKERSANAAITPGHLVEVMSTGKLRKHSGAAKSAQKAFAVENEVFGTGIDTAYAADDVVLYEVLQRGSEVNALVAAAAGAIVVGDYLESAGDGTLRKVATDTATDQSERDSLVGIALSAVDNSAGASPVRIKVEIL